MKLVNATVVRTQLSGIARRPGRLLLTGLSVLIACFLVFGAFLAQDVALRATADALSTTPPATDVVVTTVGVNGLTAEELARIRATPGVVEAVGRVEASLRIKAADRSNLTVVADPGSGPLSRIRLVSGSYPTGPGQVAVDSRTAGRLAVRAGDRITLDKGAVVVTGVVDGPADPGERAYAPDVVAAGLSFNPGEYPRIDIRTTNAQSLISDLGASFAREGTRALSVRSGQAMRSMEVREAAKPVERVFALIAMFVVVSVGAAALVATATFRIVFAQRMRQLALLRTIGAQPGQLTRALLVEGAVVGLVAGAIGVLAAQGASYAASVGARYLGTALPAPEFQTGTAIGVVIGAVLLTVCAVTAPAFKASRAAPLQAFRASSTLSAEGRISAPRLVVGLLLTVAAVGLIAYLVATRPEPGQADFDSDGALIQLVLAATAAFGALIALGPVVVGPVLAAVSWPLRRYSATGRLAVGGVGGAPRRAAGVAVVVALGVALIVATVVGTSGLMSYLDGKLATRAPADLIVSGQDDRSGISASAVTALRKDPALADVTTFRTTHVRLGQQDATALDLDLTALPALRAILPAQGAPQPGEVVLAEWAASALQVGRGDRTTLRSETGEVSVTVRAILPLNGPFSSGVVLTPGDLDRLGASGPAVLANAAASGEKGLNAARDAVKRAVADAEVSTLADLRTQATGQVSALLAVALGLLGLTVLIAVVGIGTTTVLSVHERTSEIGLLRALGLGRGGVRVMITSEAGLYGAIGAALGLLLGVPFAWLAISALNIGVPLTLPLGQLGVVVGALVVIAAVAGFVPARRAARVSPVAALATTD
ncbi:FtsX-like permease family protein [Lentzea sp. NPDC051213]|uniref:FtsX-like permease family protein n=1 Tax=Lentzea sp. NPDC051213 TaxID=3364126 RepID=UPI0037A7051E